VPTDLDWRWIPPEVAHREKAVAKLLCSILTYFQAAPARATRGAVFCAGGRGIKDVSCHDSGELQAPPRRDQPPLLLGGGRKPRPSPTVGDLATMHAQGMMIDDLERHDGEYGRVLVRQFAAYATSRTKLASYLVDVAAATSKKDELFAMLEEQLSAPDVPEENRIALSAYIAERRGEEEEILAEDRILSRAFANAPVPCQYKGSTCGDRPGSRERRRDH
jgi:hypothetical protein